MNKMTKRVCLTVPLLAVGLGLGLGRSTASAPLAAELANPKISPKGPGGELYEPLPQPTPAAELAQAAPIQLPSAPQAEAAPTSVPAGAEAMAARMRAAQPYVPEPSVEARAERDEKVAALVRSGAQGDAWLKTVSQIENDWLALDAKSGIGAELSTWDCYTAGCSVTVTLPSVEAQERFGTLVQQGATMSLWKGAGFRSGPVRAETGEIEVTWLFYSPNAEG